MFFVILSVFLVLIYEQDISHASLMHPPFAAGSEKRGLLCTRRSCPAPECLTSPDVKNHYSLIPHGDSDECMSSFDTEDPAGEKESCQQRAISFQCFAACVEFSVCQSCNCDFSVLIADDNIVLDCVVCMNRNATTFLPCGHRCLCRRCTPRVVQQFGCCPLCRQEIGAPLTEVC